MKEMAVVLLAGLIGACAGPRPPVVAHGSKSMVAVKGPQNSDAINQSYVKSGYEVIHRNGQLLYCRSEPVTGSFFRSTSCRTDAQMKAAEEIRQHAVDELENAHGGECKLVKCQ